MAQTGKETGMPQMPQIPQIQLPTIPIVTIIVLVVLILNIVSGAMKGFVRKISGLISLVLAGILVTFLLPFITSWLHTTPVYDYVRKQCETVGENLVQNTISNALNGGSSMSGTAGGGGSSLFGNNSGGGSITLDREKIKSQLRAMGYDPSIIDSMSDAELENYAHQLVGFSAGMIQPAGIMSIPPSFIYSPMLLSDSSAEAGTGSSSGSGSALLSQFTGNMNRIEQTKFIESLPLPQSIKDQMESFNNANGYQKLGASDFGSYIINYIASLIMNILAFAVAMLISWVIIRLILGSLSIFSRLPIVGMSDRILGGCLGLVQGILIVWALFLVLSMFATSEAGSVLMAEINRTPFLSSLYNMNPFLKGAAGAIKGIM